MKKFEYKRVSSRYFTKSDGFVIDVGKLNKLGSEGWELVTFTFVYNKPAFAYFKRELFIYFERGL